MGAQGSTTVDFGAFPGATDASVAVIGQTGITGTSLCEAWLIPAATSDHSADEHIVYGPAVRVSAGSVVAGTGFTIYACAPDNPGGGAAADGVRLWGQWSVGWVWN